MINCETDKKSFVRKKKKIEISSNDEEKASCRLRCAVQKKY